jgi:predicted nucleotidyltransferase
MDVSSYSRWQEQRAESDALAAKRREADVRAALPHVVRHLVERCGARRVILSGSLVGGRGHGQSDIDLLVEGLTLSALLRAGNEVEAIASLPVDLVRIEDLSPEWRLYHERYGVLIHG